VYRLGGSLDCPCVRPTCALVVCSWSRLELTRCVLRGLLCTSSHNPNKTVVYISIGFSILTIGVILIDWFLIDPFLQYFTLFYGVFFGYYAIKDIWDDT
jgi:hypothetical protein